MYQLHQRTTHVQPISQRLHSRTVYLKACQAWPEAAWACLLRRRHPHNGYAKLPGGTVHLRKPQLCWIALPCTCRADWLPLTYSSRLCHIQTPGQLLWSQSSPSTSLQQTTRIASSWIMLFGIVRDYAESLGHRKLQATPVQRRQRLCSSAGWADQAAQRVATFIAGAWERCSHNPCRQLVVR